MVVVYCAPLITPPLCYCIDFCGIVLFSMVSKFGAAVYCIVLSASPLAGLERAHMHDASRID